MKIIDKFHLVIGILMIGMVKLTIVVCQIVKRKRRNGLPHTTKVVCIRPNDFMKKILLRLRDGFVLFKFRFDAGLSFLVFINFALLIVAASSGLQKIWDVSIFVLWAVIVPIGLMGAWAFGWFLDEIVKYPEKYRNNGQMILIIKNYEVQP